ncbi:MAG: histidine--tRNA ligase [Candidatus ainarchaeum sp.]|nr:histidine--tRNA ligase [Candidatus ainarchaeum sp.]MDD3975963.1 histidine--tRNA ligase [Candidatus ainarchaeum sp.]
MKKIDISLPKGFRDFSPEEKILRDKVISIIKKAFEIYGFSPLETPIIERKEVLTAKFGAGEDSDIVGELYSFKDQGKRELGLRYEFTFALARFMAQNPQTKLPFKRYQIGSVFRDGPIKKGRYREFYQCDIDIVGAKEMIADCEIISVIAYAFKKLDLDVTIEINNRKLLSKILDFVKIPKDKQSTVIISLDKLKKIRQVGVKKELLEKDILEETIDNIFEIICQEGNNLEILNKIEEKLGQTEGILELKELFSYLDNLNISYKFLPSLARGLSYYTGPIFEVVYNDEKIMSSSLSGGGRWDEMIGKYVCNDNMNLPAVGASLGLEPIMEVIKQKEGLNKLTTIDFYICSISNKFLKEVSKLAFEFRENGINTSYDLLSRKSIGKNLDYANKLNISYVGIIGEDEINKNVIKIKDMVSGDEKEYSVKEAISFLKSKL